MPLNLRSLAEASDIRELLEYPLDFRLLAAGESLADWYRVVGDEQFTAIAGDATGSRFLLGETSEHLLYVSTEGQAGIVAASLQEFLQLLLLPVPWEDLLKFSGGGQLSEMQRCFEVLSQPEDDADVEYAEERVSAQRALALRFDLVADEAAVSLLHRAVAELSHRVPVVSPDGERFEGLFNSFTIDTVWKRATG